MKIYGSLYRMDTEAGSLQPGCQDGWILGEGSLPETVGCSCVFLFQTRGHLSHVSPLTSTLIPFTRAPPSQSNYLPKAPSPDTIALALRSLRQGSWRDTSMQRTAQTCNSISSRQDGLQPLRRSVIFKSGDVGTRVPVLESQLCLLVAM